MAELNGKGPSGPLAGKWTQYKNHQNLVNPTNKRKLDIIIVGTGLAGASGRRLGAIRMAIAIAVARVPVARAPGWRR